jgi:hypothetical protein
LSAESSAAAAAAAAAAALFLSRRFSRRLWLPDHVLCVTFEERERAKRRGARWNATLKAWVLSTREPLDSWAMKRCAAVQAPSATNEQSRGSADGARAME